MLVDEELKGFMATLKEVNFTDLSRAQELGQGYSFEDASQKLKGIHTDLKHIIDNADLLRIDQTATDAVKTMARECVRNVQEVQNFVLKGNEQNAPNQYNSINTNAENLYQQDLRILQPLKERIRVLKLDPDQITSQVEEMKKDLSQATEEIKNNFVKTADEIKKEAQKTFDEYAKKTEDIVKKLRGNLGEKGAEISRKDFEEQANSHRGVAKLWFLASIGSVVFAFLLVIFLFTKGFGFVDSLSIDIEEHYSKIIQVVVFKILLLSVAYLLVQQSIRNYKVNQHLYVLNRHRQLALTVYPYMSKASSFPDESNIIVSQAAKAIFEVGSTGYLDGDDPSTPINLTEIVNKFVESKK